MIRDRFENSFTQASGNGVSKHLPFLAIWHASPVKIFGKPLQLGHVVERIFKNRAVLQVLSQMINEQRGRKEFKEIC